MVQRERFVYVLPRPAGRSARYRTRLGEGVDQVAEPFVRLDQAGEQDQRRVQRQAEPLPRDVARELRLLLQQRPVRHDRDASRRDSEAAGERRGPRSTVNDDGVGSVVEAAIAGDVARSGGVRQQVVGGVDDRDAASRSQRQQARSSAGWRLHWTWSTSGGRRSRSASSAAQSSGYSAARSRRRATRAIHQAHPPAERAVRQAEERWRSR